MFPTQITLRNLRPTPELHDRIRDVCDKLGSLNPRILSCRVAIEQPIVRTRRHTRTPSPVPFFVDVTLRLPGREITSLPQEHAELDVAVRRAFVLIRKHLRAETIAEPENARNRGILVLAN